MKKNRLIPLATLLFLGCSRGPRSTKVPDPSEIDLLKRYLALPMTSSDLGHARRRLLARDPLLAQGVADLVREARSDLDETPLSVLDKKARLRNLPKEIRLPTKDLRHYVSFSRYAWPNPDTPDRLPYVLRDGKANQDLIAIGDAPSLAWMLRNTAEQALAFAYTGEERYRKKALELLTAWFLHPETGMYPRFTYAALLPMAKGEARGDPGGLIEAKGFCAAFDLMRVLALPKESDAARGLGAWFKSWNSWIESPQSGAEEERGARNNHGAWFDAQRVGVLLLIGRRGEARALCADAREARIAASIEPDGTQPLELKRPDALGYSVFGLMALGHLATLCSEVGVDLWRYESPDGRSIRKALRFLYPYLHGDEEWPFKQRSALEAKDYELLISWTADLGWFTW